MVDISHTGDAIVALRLASSLAWLDSALIGKDAKLAPAFLSGAGLAQRVHDTFVHTALTPAIAHLLRAGAAAEIARAVVNILIGGGAGTDTIGFNAMLITAGGIALASRAGRRFGLDRLLLARHPNTYFLAPTCMSFKRAARL